jgi:predicted CopG family antitoxin
MFIKKESEKMKKTIKISEETYHKLKRMKIVPEESFNSVIKRLIEKCGEKEK